MARRTIYGVQPFDQRWDGFHPRQLLVFHSASDAEEAGERLARIFDGIIVFMQDGDPEWDVWDEADVLAQHGFVPTAYLTAA